MNEQPCFLWSNSTIVLAWLQKPAYSWITFVANCVALIKEKVGNCIWNHVNSKENPADLASRGITAMELAESSLWWQGPTWLRLIPFPRPSCSVNFETSEEIRPVKSHVTQVSPTDFLLRFSDLPRAMRVICYIFGFFICPTLHNVKVDNTLVMTFVNQKFCSLGRDS
ncbi:uncharacterized protein LOC124420609 [Lucilia cuprina]|uniref:uncharacterized protein LOC124420609 n=1 Tax=Lucilia cuprina TaxID=7375 RepID=UPI001F06CBD1|nr:uncharacterized protein LOC124420609 [Lucilia cuprina]